MVKIAQPLGSLHCNFVSRMPMQMFAIVSMKQLSQASIRHVFIHQKISVMVGAKRQQFNYVSVPDFTKNLDLRRETMII